MNFDYFFNPENWRYTHAAPRVLNEQLSKVLGRDVYLDFESATQVAPPTLPPAAGRGYKWTGEAWLEVTDYTESHLYYKSNGHHVDPSDPARPAFEHELPETMTTQAPEFEEGELEANKAEVWSEEAQAWVVVDDYSKAETYSKATVERVVLEVGQSLDEAGATLLVPTDIQSWDEATQSWVDDPVKIVAKAKSLIPKEVPNWAALLVLLREGITEAQILAQIDTMLTPAQAEEAKLYLRRPYWRRDSALINSLAAQFGMSEDAVDAFFVAAAEEAAK